MILIGIGILLVVAWIASAICEAKKARYLTDLYKDINKDL